MCFLSDVELATAALNCAKEGFSLFKLCISPYIERKHIENDIYRKNEYSKIEEKKNQNIDSILFKASALIKESVINDIKDNWFLHYIDIISKISEEDMQNLFAAILKGETQSPGRYSIRTLYTLSMLNQEECKLLVNAIKTSVIWDNRIFVMNDLDLELSGEIGLTSYSELVDLEQCGIVKINETGFKITSKNDYYDVSYGDEFAIIDKTMLCSNQIGIGSFACFTKVGSELYSLIKEFQNNLIDYELFHHYLRKLSMANRTSFKIHTIISREGPHTHMDVVPIMEEDYTQNFDLS